MAHVPLATRRFLIPAAGARARPGATRRRPATAPKNSPWRFAAVSEKE
jgi:hypothetical protein